MLGLIEGPVMAGGVLLHLKRAGGHPTGVRGLSGGERNGARANTSMASGAWHVGSLADGPDPGLVEALRVAVGPRPPCKGQWHC
jgi:hypothetical protein